MAITYLDNETKKLFEEGDKFIYRVTSLDRVLDMFEYNRLVFVSPEMWNDPFEKAFLVAKYKFNDTEFELPIKPSKSGTSLFAQCWTLTSESEAFWNTYAPNKDGISICIRASNLKNILSSIQKYNVFVGLAKYQHYDKLYEFKGDNEYWKALSEKGTNESHLKLLLKKRIQFKYEQELRILLVRKKPMKPKISRLRVGMIANKIESIIIDPRMGSQLVELVKKTFPQYGFEGKCVQSGLYRKPARNVTFDNTLSLDDKIEAEDIK